MRPVHQWPPMQQGEAREATAQGLLRYINQHRRWMIRQSARWAAGDNYLALHRANAARVELHRRTGKWL